MVPDTVVTVAVTVEEQNRAVAEITEVFNPEVIRDTTIYKLEELDEDHDDARVAAEMTALLLQARLAFQQ